MILLDTLVAVTAALNAASFISASNVHDDAATEVRNVVSKDPSILNVHLVAHTHDDVGWLKTVDQYFYGLNNTIQHANVRLILDTSIRALEENPDRKFTYAEMKFFTMWWNQQDENKRASVKKLVAENRLSFTNGGWTMHDEAATHFIGMIDQTTLGHSFLKETFDYVPRTGWQIDPFGHSVTQASLFTADVGFDAVYLGRIDHQDLELRLNEKRCEGIWDTSDNIADQEVFWSLTGSYGGTYGPPKGLCFDTARCRNPVEPVIDGINIDERVSTFVERASWQARHTRGNNIMFTMGSDFHFENAFENFRHMDQLIKHVNAYAESGKIRPKDLGNFTSINVFYSNPEMFTLAKNSEGMEWEVKTDDWLPYSSCDTCFWTGYYTSRPSLKKIERFGTSLLLASRQIEAMGSAANDDEIKSIEESPLFSLEDGLGIIQHHDGITGTSKQHVTDDFILRIDKGIKEASSFAASALEGLLDGSMKLEFCQHLNVTTCQTSQAATKDMGTDTYVVAYNALSSEREEIISIPISVDATYEVYDADENNKMNSVLMPSFNPSNAKGAASYVLYVETGSVPPVGAVVLRLKMVSKESSIVLPSTDLTPVCQNVGGGRKFETSSDIAIDNGIIQVIFDSSTGMMKGMQNDNTSVDLSQEWGYYTSYKNKKGIDDRGKLQNSGAYVFRPAHSTLNILDNQCGKTVFYQSDLVTEIHSEFSSWVKQIIRIKKNHPYVEVEYTAGPVPINDGNGRELVTRFKSSIENNGVFYNDANGRDFVKRKLGYRATWDLKEKQPISGNYYPVAAGIFIEDDKASMSVLPDRAQGGSSLSNGVIELMVHRRFTMNDRGVHEILDETDKGIEPYPPYGKARRKGKGLIITGSHRLMVGEGKSGASICRSEMDESFSPLQLFFGSAPTGSKTPFRKSSFSSLKSSLPKNAMLVTLAKIHPYQGSFLVRLGHQYGANEGVFSAPVRVDMSKLFTNYTVNKIIEKTLSGNQEMESWNSAKLKWNSQVSKNKERGRLYDNGTIIQLNPLEIRTFEVFVDNGEKKSSPFRTEKVEVNTPSQGSVLIAAAAFSFLVGITVTLRRRDRRNSITNHCYHQKLAQSDDDFDIDFDGDGGYLS